jgi:hypothetical protein
MELLGDEEKYRVGPWNPAYGLAAGSLQKSVLILSCALPAKMKVEPFQ